MSHTAPSQHAAVVLRSNYEHLRALLAIAIALILALTVAVVVLATTGNSGAPAGHAGAGTQSATRAHSSAGTGAELDHSGRHATVLPRAHRLTDYPDAPPPSIGASLAGGSSYRLGPLH